jgi:hypothetical protein
LRYPSSSSLRLIQAPVESRKQNVKSKEEEKSSTTTKRYVVIARCNTRMSSETELIEKVLRSDSVLWGENNMLTQV